MNSIVKKPWGYYEILKSGKKFLVKKLFIKPGGMLSLQNHEHRSEHWLVAEGEVEITLDKKNFISQTLINSDFLCFLRS